MSKFLPPRPKAIYIDGQTRGDMALQQQNLNEWYDKEIAPLFENAVEVYGEFDATNEVWSDFSGLRPLKANEGVATHKALLVNIEPLKKEETAEDVLREMVDAFKTTTIIPYQGEVPKFNKALDRARKYLEKKK